MKATVRFAVKETDKGWKKIKLALEDARNRRSHVRIGVFGSSTKARRPGEPIDNVTLAMVHEFGSKKAGVPERSFIRAPFNAKAQENRAMLARLLGGFYEGKMPLERVLGLMGLKITSDMQAWVRAGTNLLPLSPATRAIKEKKGKWQSGALIRGPDGRFARARPDAAAGAGGPIPLIDTGRLIGSITWMVVMGDGAQKEGAK